MLKTQSISHGSTILYLCHIKWFVLIVFKLICSALDHFWALFCLCLQTKAGAKLSVVTNTTLHFSKQLTMIEQAGEQIS